MKQLAKTKLVRLLKENPLVEGFGDTKEGFFVLLRKGAKVWRDAVPEHVDGYKVRIRKTKGN